MPVMKDPQSWTVDDCVEDCRYSSRSCYEKRDGTMVCPEGWRQCAENCQKHYAS